MEETGRNLKVQVPSDEGRSRALSIFSQSKGKLFGKVHTRNRSVIEDVSKWEETTSPTVQTRCAWAKKAPSLRSPVTYCQTMSPFFTSSQRVSFGKQNMVSVASERAVQIWCSQTGALLRTLSCYDPQDATEIETSLRDLSSHFGFRSLASKFSPNGNFFAMTSFRLSGDEIGCEQTIVEIYDALCGFQIKGVVSVECPPDNSLQAVSDLAFSPDSSMLAVVCYTDARVRIVDLATFETQILECPQHELDENPDLLLHSIAISSRGTIAAISKFHPKIYLWNSETFEFIGSIFDQSWRLLLRPSIAFHPDSQHLFVLPENEGRECADVYLCDVENCRFVTTVVAPHPFGHITFLDVCPDGSVVTGGSDRSLRFSHLVLASDPSDPPTLEETTSLRGHKDSILHASLSPDQKRAITISSDHSGRVWDIEQSEEIQYLSGPDGVSASDYSSTVECSVVAYACPGRTSIALWYCDSARQFVKQLWGHSSEPTALSFSPDGKLLCSGSRDGSVKVWSVAELSEVLSLSDHTTEIVAIQWSDKTIATLDASGLFNVFSFTQSQSSAFALAKTHLRLQMHTLPTFAAAGRSGANPHSQHLPRHSRTRSVLEQTNGGGGSFNVRFANTAPDGAREPGSGDSTTTRGDVHIRMPSGDDLLSTNTFSESSSPSSPQPSLHRRMGSLLARTPTTTPGGSFSSGSGSGPTPKRGHVQLASDLLDPNVTTRPRKPTLVEAAPPLPETLFLSSVVQSQQVQQQEVDTPPRLLFLGDNDEYLAVLPRTPRGKDQKLHIFSLKKTKSGDLGSEQISSFPISTDACFTSNGRLAAFLRSQGEALTLLECNSMGCDVTGKAWDEKYTILAQGLYGGVNGEMCMSNDGHILAICNGHQVKLLRSNGGHFHTAELSMVEMDEAARFHKVVLAAHGSSFLVQHGVTLSRFNWAAPLVSSTRLIQTAEDKPPRTSFPIRPSLGGNANNRNQRQGGGGGGNGQPVVFNSSTLHRRRMATLRKRGQISAFGMSPGLGPIGGGNGASGGGRRTSRRMSWENPVPERQLRFTPDGTCLIHAKFETHMQKKGIITIFSALSGEVLHQIHTNAYDAIPSQDASILACSTSLLEVAFLCSESGKPLLEVPIPEKDLQGVIDATLLTVLPCGPRGFALHWGGTDLQLVTFDEQSEPKIKSVIEIVPTRNQRLLGLHHHDSNNNLLAAFCNRTSEFERVISLTSVQGDIAIPLISFKKSVWAAEQEGSEVLDSAFFLPDGSGVVIHLPRCDDNEGNDRLLFVKIAQGGSEARLVSELIYPRRQRFSCICMSQDGGALYGLVDLGCGLHRIVEWGLVLTTGDDGGTNNLSMKAEEICCGMDFMFQDAVVGMNSSAWCGSPVLILRDSSGAVQLVDPTWRQPSAKSIKKFLNLHPKEDFSGVEDVKRVLNAVAKMFPAAINDFDGSAMSQEGGGGGPDALTVLHQLSAHDLIRIWLSSVAPLSLLADSQRLSALDGALLSNDREKVRLILQKCSRDLKHQFSDIRKHSAEKAASTPSSPLITLKSTLQQKENLDMVILQPMVTQLSLPKVLEKYPDLVKTHFDELTHERVNSAHDTQTRITTGSDMLVRSSQMCAEVRKQSDAVKQSRVRKATKSFTGQFTVPATAFIAPVNGLTSNVFLNALVQREDLSVFDSVFTKALVTYKWEAFGRKLFLRRMVTFLLFILCFSTCTLWSAELNDPQKDVFSMYQTYSDWIRAGLEALTLIFNLTYAVLEFQQFHRERTRYLHDVWNFVELTAFFLIFAIVPLRIVRSNYELSVTGVAAILLWLRMLSFARGFTRTGIFIRMIFQVIEDITPFFLVILTFIIAFAHCYYLIHQGLLSGYDTFGESLLTLYQMMMNNWDISGFETSNWPTLSIFLFVVFTVCVSIIFLNLLIAIMNSAYTRVNNNTSNEFLLERAKVLLEFEAQMPDVKRHSQNIAPRYLSYLVPSHSVPTPKTDELFSESTATIPQSHATTAPHGSSIDDLSTLESRMIQYLDQRVKQLEIALLQALADGGQQHQRGLRQSSGMRESSSPFSF